MAEPSVLSLKPVGVTSNNADGQDAAAQQQRDQMLRMVSKGFYNELTNYGVQKDEILHVASLLLDNLMAQETQPGENVRYYNQVFTLGSVKNEWHEHKQLSVEHVTLRPIQLPVIAKIARWLKDPAIRDSFVPAFPEKESDLQRYFTHPARDYSAIYFEDEVVGIVGGENIDPFAAKLEMKKLVGEPDLQGKGIGKRATFGFLYYAFMILGMNKVYVHSRDVNIHNLNLNNRFGFELEGIFFEDIHVGNKRQDVVRMALFKKAWLEIFSRAATDRRQAGLEACANA